MNKIACIECTSIVNNISYFQFENGYVAPYVLCQECSIKEKEYIKIVHPISIVREISYEEFLIIKAMES